MNASLVGRDGGDSDGPSVWASSSVADNPVEVVEDREGVREWKILVGLKTDR